MKSETRTFELEKVTKNTFRYEEATDGVPPAFGKIYVQKWLIDDEPPDELSVTVETKE
jgi:hypothetical protein